MKEEVLVFIEDWKIGEVMRNDLTPTNIICEYIEDRDVVHFYCEVGDGKFVESETSYNECLSLFNNWNNYL